MASNNLQANPMSIVGSVTGYKTATAAAQGTLRSLLISKIRWVNPGTSQSVTIGDPVSGLTLWSAKSNSSGEDVETDWDANPVLWQDFAINSLPGSGTILIWTR
jgi:hypothetical protein